MLAEDIAALVKTVLTVSRAADDVKQSDFFAGSLEKAYERCEKFIPERYLREMDALADAAGLQRKDVRLINIFPEMFHCSGFALMGRATDGGELLHGRILDYMTEIGLQTHAIMFLSLPDGWRAFINAGYASFIGFVTGSLSDAPRSGRGGAPGGGH